VWTKLFQLNHTQSLNRGKNGPKYCNDSEWGQHASKIHQNDGWYNLGVYLIWVKDEMGKFVLVYIGEGQVQERLCCWEEHNLGFYNHDGRDRFVNDYPEEKPEYFCQYFLIEDSKIAEQHIMWLCEKEWKKSTIYNKDWDPKNWDKAPIDLALPSHIL
jgi:hypothetical protein